VSLAAGYAIYRASEPSFRDLRQQHVLTKSDLASVSDHLHQLSNRLTKIEQSRVATLNDLEQLKTLLETEIEHIRAGTK
jgi:predicted  nucleic acid-binding Zn-ribbon protein